jgi:hypothetical protein
MGVALGHAGRLVAKILPHRVEVYSFHYQTACGRVAKRVKRCILDAHACESAPRLDAQTGRIASGNTRAPGSPVGKFWGTIPARPFKASTGRDCRLSLRGRLPFVAGSDVDFDGFDQENSFMRLPRVKLSCVCLGLKSSADLHVWRRPLNAQGLVAVEDGEGDGVGGHQGGGPEEKEGQ